MPPCRFAVLARIQTLAHSYELSYYIRKKYECNMKVEVKVKDGTGEGARPHKKSRSLNGDDGDGDDHEDAHHHVGDGGGDAKQQTEQGKEQVQPQSLPSPPPSSSLPSSSPNIPTFDVASPDFNDDVFREAYEHFQVVHLTGALQGRDRADKDLAQDQRVLSADDVGHIYAQLNEEDQQSWCIETQIKDKTGKHKESRTPSTPTTPRDFLSNDVNHDKTVAYCSFLIQKDADAYASLLPRLPVSTLPFAPQLTYEPCIWMFFGRNCSIHQQEPMQGRPEHTDSVSHDGTWHYQLAGTKRWLIRPTPNLLQRMTDSCQTMAQPSALRASVELWSQSKDCRTVIECEHGDIIVINTKLWYHQTVIPHPTARSISYARDFWLGTPQMGTSMSNVDGMYATEDVVAGTVIFTEHDMPDGELHRSKSAANCQVVELDDGTSAVVSSRDIVAGDFFCIPESSSEEDDDDGDGDGEEFGTDDDGGGQDDDDEEE